MEAVDAFGARLTSPRGTWRGDGPTIEVDQLEAGLFQGGVRGSVRLGVLEAGVPGRATLVLDALDLAAFSAEVQPPHTRLTGLADGTLALAFSTGGLQDLRLDLEATESVSINRDLLHRLAKSEYAHGFFGSAQIRRAWSDIVGETGQRPFDRAALRLAYEEDRYRGPLRLESEQLSLTLDLAIDEQVVAEALALAGEGALEGVEIGGGGE
jgi:hypothetical protein